MEVGKMPYHWPADTDFALWELDVLDRDCPACGRRMYICDHRYRHLHTLDVVRALAQKRVWFAEPLLSATEDQVRRLIQKSKEWAQSLGTPVGLWVSDRQNAFVAGIAAEFPDVPHRYCDNHFLRDLAKP